MVESSNQTNNVSAEEALKTEIIVSQALIDILIAKQVISEEELIAGIRKIRREQLTLLNGTKKNISLQKRQ